MLGQPENITHDGRTLRDSLDDHKLWLLSKGKNGRRASLDGASLDGAILDGARLNRASLYGARLNRASLCGASLYGARLYGAILDGAILDGARLDGARLDGASLDGARLNRAILNGASLDGARLNGASLDGARGNMREVKSAQFDRWAITWTTAPDGIVTLQIGCQRHPLEMWEKSDPRWIAAMDAGATEWWAQYRETVLTLVQSSPAVPWGTPTKETA